MQAYKPKKVKVPKRKPKEDPDYFPDDENTWEDSDDSQSKMVEDIETDYNIVQLPSNEQEQHNNPLEEEHFSDSFSIIEEIAEEVVGTDDHIIEDSTDTIRRIETLLMGFEGESQQRIERRLMAFLCKCQLRALTDQGIEDLYV